MKSQVYFTSILSGFYVSTPGVNVMNATDVGIFLPIVTSGTMYPLVSISSAGTYTRVRAWGVASTMENIGSLYPIGSGSVSFRDLIAAHNFLVFESGIMQTDTRTFAITVKY